MTLQWTALDPETDDATTDASTRGDSTDDDTTRGDETNDEHETGLLRPFIVGLTSGSIAYYLLHHRLRESKRPIEVAERAFESEVSSQWWTRGMVTEGGIPAGDDGPTTTDDREEPERLSEKRSREELDELAESDVQETPAQPGELTVGEDVIEEVVDESEE